MDKIARGFFALAFSLTCVVRRSGLRGYAMSGASGFGGLAIVIAGMVLLTGGGPARAAGNSEQQCELGRYRAAAAYGACELKALAKQLGGAEVDTFTAAASRCRDKYRAIWAKLEVKASGSGSACDAARFVDNGDGTVTDNLTALQWEKKTNLDGTSNLADRHDADNTYTWSATGTAADGTGVTDFLANLNSGGCFAGQCDWRLPTVEELQTLLIEVYPCSTSPCVDGTLGPTPSAPAYWSSTTNASFLPDAWSVGFDSGRAADYSPKYVNLHVRAVRGGL